MIDPTNITPKNLTECQSFCATTLGCLYFSWTTGYVDKCFLKTIKAVASWNEHKTSPDINGFSGPAKCGRAFKLHLILILFKKFRFEYLYRVLLC